MIIFNNVEYNDIEYNNPDEIKYGGNTYRFHNLKITSPYNIVDYTQMLIDGKIPEGEVRSLDFTGGSFSRELVKERYESLSVSNQIPIEALIKPMLQCNDINFKLFQIEKCKSMSVGELKELSSNIPDVFNIDEIERFLELSKYDINNVANSGFTGSQQTKCYRALFTTREKFGNHIEYTNSLNDFLHKTYFTSSYRDLKAPNLEELIGIYYQYPHIADVLLHGDRTGAEFIYEMIHQQISGFEPFREGWEFSEEHIKVLNTLEKQLSYYYEHHEDKDELIAYNVEHNLYSFLNVDAITVAPHLSLKEDKVPKGILVQSNFEPDAKKYIFPDFDKLAQTLTAKPYEALELEGLGLSIFNEIKPFDNDYDRFRPIVEPVLAKAQEIILKKSKGWVNLRGQSDIILSLTVEDICKELQEKHMDKNSSALKILEQTIESISQKVRIDYINELNYMHITYHIGKQYTNGDDLSFLHCFQMKNVDYRPLFPYKDSKEQELYSYFRQDAKNAMFIMPEKMIKKLHLTQSDEFKPTIIFDKDFIQAIRKSFIDSTRAVLQEKALHQTPIIEAQAPYTELTNAFKEKYGRTPRIMPQISVALNNYFQGNVEECVDLFNYKRVNKIQGAKTPIMIKLSSAFDWNRIPTELQQLLKYNVTPSNINIICKYSDIITEFYYNSKNKELIDFMEVIDKALDEDISALRKTIQELHSENDNARKNELRESINVQVSSMIAFVQQQRGLIDAYKAEKSYDYNFVNNSSSIMGDDICVMSGPYKAYFLNSMDTRHFSVGYDTVCCQHIDGVGEECVIAATSSPHCGTFVIESDGDIKAQAFVWESLDKEGKKVLVLDNIEFANDRKATDYIEILYGFCKESPYDTIHMGLSYNVVSYIGRNINNTEYVHQPMTAHINGQFYSDYDSVVSLKTNGQIEFDVGNVKYYVHKFETPTIIESETHCINQNKDSLTAQHYDGMADIASKTTMVFASDGTKKEPNNVLPVYSFDSTIPLKHNYMMKWDEIQPDDCAITIIHLPPQPDHKHGQYIVKPVSLDGATIREPNSLQRKNIFCMLGELAKENPEDELILKTNQGDIPIQMPKDLLQIQTENYISSETNDIYGDELLKLEVAIEKNFGCDSQHDDNLGYDWDDYWDDYDDYERDQQDYEDNVREDEESSEEQNETQNEECDEEYDEQQAFDDKWADWEDWGDRL